MGPGREATTGIPTGPSSKSSQSAISTRSCLLTDACHQVFNKYASRLATSNVLSSAATIPGAIFQLLSVRTHEGLHWKPPSVAMAPMKGYCLSVHLLKDKTALGVGAGCLVVAFKFQVVKEPATSASEICTWSRLWAQDMQTKGGGKIPCEEETLCGYAGCASRSQDWHAQLSANSCSRPDLDP